MNDDIKEELREAFADPEYRHAYASSFLNTSIAAQIKALRDARGLTQEELGSRAGMAQESICRLENVNYSSWSISTLRRLAQAFDLALVVRFDGFGSLLDDIASLNRESLERPSFGDDPAFISQGHATVEPVKVDDLTAHRNRSVGRKLALQGGISEVNFGSSLGVKVG